MRINFNIRLKSMITITLLISGVASLLSFYFINHERDVIDRALRQRGQTLASNLAYNAEYGVLTANSSILNNLLVGVRKQPDVAYVIIQELDSNILAVQGLKEEIRNLQQFKAVSSRALQTEEPLIQPFSSISGSVYYDIVVPITTEEIEIFSDELGMFGEEENILDQTIPTGDKSPVKRKKIGVVRVGLSLLGAEILTRQSRNAAFIITTFVILLSMLFTMIVTGIAVVPIRKLVEGTEKVSRGDLNFQVSVREGDEIGHLAKSFNQMTQDLRISRDELVKAKEYTDNIIRSMIDILFVIDPKGIIRTVNPATVQVLGYEEHELVGEPVDFIISTEGTQISPRVHITRQLLKEGFISGYEMKYRTKAGEIIPVIFSGAVMVDEEGEVAGIVGIAKNITDRKKAEEALQESNERFTALAANMPGMIYQFLLKSNGKMEFPYVSPGSKELFGLDPKVLQNDAKLVIDMIHPEDREGFDKLVDTSARTLKPWRWEGRFIKDNQIKWVQGASRPKKLENNSVLWDGVLMDISERKIAQSLIELKSAMLEKVNQDLVNNERKLNKMVTDLRNTNEQLQKAHEELKQTQFQLHQSERLKVVGRLASGVAHEVKNPLAIILQGVSFISSKLPKEDEILSGVVEDIKNAVHRADSVIKGVLDFASMQELDMSSRDIHNVVDAALLLVKHEFDQHRIEVKKKFAQKIPKVKIDRNKIEQVFINLFLNSVQAMEKGGTLTLHSYMKKVSNDDILSSKDKPYPFEENDSLVCIEIIDTGGGIAENNMKKIFDPFFTTKGGTGGTGLGLPIINNIIELHKGNISIENVKEGGVKTTLMLRV